MKKLITSAFFFLLMFGANATGNQNQVNQNASQIARKLANEIQLNESEYIQVKNYTVELITFEAQIKEMYSTSPEMMERKLTEIHKDYSHKITSLLNVKQFEMYQALNNKNLIALPAIAEAR